MATEQDLLAARLEDSIKLSRKRPCFLGFLDEAQAAFCQERLSRRQDVAYLSWGGHEYAERVVLGFFPDYLEPAPEYFPSRPLCSLTARRTNSPTGTSWAPLWPWAWSAR